MHRIIATALLSSGLFVLHGSPLGAQRRPDFSGTWTLDAAASRMIGRGGESGPVQLGARRITWLIDHRDAEIAVTVKVRDPDGPHDFSFRCTTDGRQCVNELPELREVREISTRWIADTLLMSQSAKTPHGSFTAEDRLTLADSGSTLVFERVVRDERGQRTVKQVFRKAAAAPLRQTP